MDNRISKPKMFMEIALVLSKRANCQRGSVGAVITKNNRIISTGYNGPLHGSIPCSSKICDLDSPCTRSVHAELNAILHAAREGISTDGTTLYCTTLPCSACAKAIIQAGIKTVYYLNEYRNKESLEIFKYYGITVIREEIS